MLKHQISNSQDFSLFSQEYRILLGSGYSVSGDLSLHLWNRLTQIVSQMNWISPNEGSELLSPIQKGRFPMDMVNSFQLSVSNILTS